MRRRGGNLQLGRVLLACLLASAPASPGLGGTTDCAPLGGPPEFRVLEDAEHRDYDAIEFTLLRGGVPATKIVAGAKCYQVYVAGDAPATASVAELQARYRERLAALGAQILFTDRNRIHARLIEDGRETWLRVNVQDHEVDVTVLHKRPLTPTLTRPPARDPRLFGHMPHYEEVAADKNADDVRRFAVQDEGDGRTVEVRGVVREFVYAARSRDRLSSDAEIQENYRSALRARGAQILLADWRTTVARLAQRGRMIWVRVTSQVSEITVLSVEDKLPPSKKRPAEAALKAALARDGRATLAWGLGVGPAMLARVDRKIAAQMARLLRRDRALALTVVVHSDDLGDRGENLRLSQAFADAIVEAVVRRGIPRNRIAALGAGPDRPAAENATEEGRARNRRIELVKSAPPPRQSRQ